MAAADLGELEAKLKHVFASRELLEQALTHGSLRHEQQSAQPSSHGAQGRDDAEAAGMVQDNERLEFLGDAIVGMATAEILYRRFPELDEGELTRLRAALVSRRHLGQVGLGLSLGAYLRLSKAEERSGGRKKSVLLANCMEALAAALYLDGGIAKASAFVEALVVAPYLDALRGAMRENSAIGDHKSALQELLQARHWGQPEYTVQAESGPDHRKRFQVEARVVRGAGQVESAQGEGSTKKRAEQEAARRLFDRLRGPAAASGEGEGEARGQAQGEALKRSQGSPESAETVEAEARGGSLVERVRYEHPGREAPVNGKRRLPKEASGSPTADSAKRPAGKGAGERSLSRLPVEVLP